MMWSKYSVQNTFTTLGLGAVVAQSVYRSGYGLDDRGSTPGWGNDGNFKASRLAMRAHPAFYPMGTGGPYTVG
jgi:hypothetical protein